MCQIKWRADLIQLHCPLSSVQSVAAGVGAMTGLWELVSETSAQCAPVSPYLGIVVMVSRPAPAPPQPPLNTRHYLILLYYDSGEFWENPNNHIHSSFPMVIQMIQNINSESSGFLDLLFFM